MQRVWVWQCLRATSNQRWVVGMEVVNLEAHSEVTKEIHKLFIGLLILLDQLSLVVEFSHLLQLEDLQMLQ